MTLTEIRGAVARGWCTRLNDKKPMDADLAEAIVQEVHKALLADRTAYLGCASTGELLDELRARIETDGKLGYRTIDD
jgi:hypothetical protein